MPTITFGGVGSGIDTESIISGLISASRGPLDRVQQQNTRAQSAISSLSDIGNLLSKLKDSLVALDTVQEVGSFKVTSDSKAIVASATGAAQAGSFKIEVTQLASAYKAYSNLFGVTQSNQALNQSGTLSLSVGGKSADVELSDSDTLDQVISKINSSGLRVAASSFFDGEGFRLQLRGLDTGLENDVTVVESGTSFGFADNTKSTGQDAKIKVDDFEITSKTNQVQGALAGVTLALTAETEGPVTVTVDSDPEGFQAKLKTLVDAYNAVVNKVHTEAGFGTIKASNPELAGDSALRTVTNRLGSALSQAVGNGKFQTLGSIGLTLNNNGTLKLDSAKLNAALTADPASVTRVIAGDDSNVKGFADMLAGVVTDLTGSNGILTARKDSLSSRQRQLVDRADIEQKRLDRMEDMLRKQFSQMDQVVSANQAQINFLR